MKGRMVRLLRSGISNFLIIFLGVGMLYPVLWLIAASFKENAAIFSDPRLIPRTFTLKNYVQGWKGIGIVGFGTFFRNSFLISSLCVVANVTFCSLTAYAFARLRFAGKRVWFSLIMLTMVVPKLFATDAFFIFLLVQFIRSLPKDMDESAVIDGCGEFGIYARIIMPLTVPALITTVLFTFLWTWDDFFTQLLYLNSPPTYTVPMGLRLFIDASGIYSWGTMFAMSVLSLVPCLVLFFSLQKYFVQGITTTGIKG